MTSWTPDLSRHDGPRYRAIADAIAADLHAGQLKPGDRLPTHRDLAYRLGVTVGTVTRAYAEAQRRGLLEGHVGRGSFLAGLTRPAPSLPASGLTMADHESTGMIELSLAFPPQATDELLQRTLTELARQPGVTRLLNYQPHAGMAHHRAAGAAWIGRHGLEVPADRVIVTAGAQHGLCVVAGTLLKPGDLLLSEGLTYPGLRAVGELFKLRLKGLPLDDGGIIPEALESICRTEAPRALYCMPGLQNPTGAVMPAERRQAIAAILRRYGVVLIEDDIYGFLGGTLPPLSAALPELGHYLVGTSKSMGPGLRIGFLVTPPGPNTHYVATLRATTWMAPPLLAEIACRWITDGTAAQMVEAQRRSSTERQTLTRSLLADFDYRAHPQSYYGMLYLPAPWRASDFVAAGARRGLRLRAAETFAVEQAPPEAIRICICAVETTDILTTGLERIVELLREGPAADNLVV
ncbi:MAG TPA: PLP-dependent aminotransferase family protein [Dongiaceae bacterium]|nr:PLP-dependent aminotransferase family protein [Dongiaceae bacterium]